MNQRSDIDRLLTTWLDDGPTTMPDSVVDVVADRIDRTRQRRSWRLLRRLPMSPLVKLGIAAAAVLFIAVVGYSLLPKQPGVGGQPTPVPSPTATIPPLPEGTVTAAGTYRLTPFFSPATMTVDATVPEGGWLGGPPCCIAGPNDANGPNGVAVALLKAETINSDPCHWDKDGSGTAPQEGDIEVGPTVADLAEALAANPAFASTTPTDVAISGFQGKRLDLQLAADLSACDGFEVDSPVYFVFGGREGGFYAKGDNNRWQVSILDVDGTRLIVVLLSYPGTPAADLSAAQGILDSLVITP